MWKVTIYDGTTIVRTHTLRTWAAADHIMVKAIMRDGLTVDWERV